MKTVNSTTKELQISMGQIPDILELITIYEQYSGIVNEVTSATNFKVLGDATGLLSVGDVITSYLTDFPTTDTIATISYSGGNDETTITLSGSGLTNIAINVYIQKQTNITTRVLINGIGNTIQKLEGFGLNKFDSGSLDITVNNSDGFFFTSAGVGVFGLDNVIYGSYEIGFKGASDLVLYFAGVVDAAELDINLSNKTVKFRIHGHTKELERYPAFLLSDIGETQLNIISGFRIYAYTKSDYSEEGVKKIEYKPFSNSPLTKSISVQSVSIDTTPGIKKLEFKFPDLLRWDNGAWTSSGVGDMNSDGNVKLYADNGVTRKEHAIVNVGDGTELNGYSDRDDEIWVSIKEPENFLELKSMVGNIGRPIMRFDNGVWEPIKIHFQTVLTKVSSTYTDIENVNIHSLDTVSGVLASNNDELIIIAPEEFYGLQFIFTSLFSASSLSFYYSIGGVNWSSSFSPTDGTSEFQQDGKITWGELSGWTYNDIEIDATTHYKGFMIRIVRNSATGGATIGELKRLIRMKGEKGDFLELEVNQKEVFPEDLDDEVILHYDKVSDVWNVYVWYQNVSLKILMDKIFIETNYPATQRSVTDMKKTSASAVFNIWGKSPKIDHRLYGTCIYYDETNDYLYLGLGGDNWCEIWRSQLDGRWEQLGEKIWHTGMDRRFEFEVFDIWFDTPYIYYVVREKISWMHPFAIINKYLIGRWHTSTKIHEWIDDEEFYDVQQCGRKGEIRFDGGSNYYRVFGQGVSGSTNYGENLCVPYNQVIAPAYPSNNNTLYPCASLDEPIPGAAFPVWYYDEDWQGFGSSDSKSGPKARIQMGYYGVDDASGQLSPPDPEVMYLGCNFGQKGNGFVYRANSDFHAFFEEIDGGGSTTWYKLKGMGASVADFKVAHYNINHLPLCSYIDESTEEIYFGMTRWWDLGDDTKCYSYITKFKNVKVVNADKVWRYDDSLTSYNEETDSFNNGTGFSGAFFGVQDAWYIAMDDYKFRSMMFELSHVGATNVYVYEYWNGSSWTALEDTPDDDIPDKIVCWSFPQDWVKNTVNGYGTAYWMRVRCTTYNSQGDTEDETGITEYVIWDSQVDSGNERMMCVNLCYNPDEDTLHGCMFERDDGVTYPFQWSYFVIDFDDITLYHFRTGDNFTFDSSYVFKNFTHNTNDDLIYCMTENMRYREKPPYLVKASFNTSTNALTLTKVGIPDEGGDSQYVSNLHITTTGEIYGVTNAVLWEYATDFYPRVMLAKFGEGETIKKIIEYISEIMNYYVYIHSDRTLDFFSRDNINGTIALDWATNIIQKPPEFKNWEHKYDAVRVEWNDPVFELSGSKKRGYTNWLKKILEINNPLIQSSHLADLIAIDNYAYFNQYRVKVEKIQSLFLIQLECIDKFTIFIPDNIMDIDSTKEFLIDQIRINRSQKQLEISGVEII